VKTTRMSKEIWQGPRIVILISYCYPMMEYVGAIGHETSLQNLSFNSSLDLYG
jgi:hypothetical protein